MIPQLGTVLVARVSTEKSLKMKEFGFLILTRVFYPWQMPVLTPMAHNSSFAMAPLLTSMVNTPYSEES